MYCCFKEWYSNAEANHNRGAWKGPGKDIQSPLDGDRWCDYFWIIYTHGTENSWQAPWSTFKTCNEQACFFFWLVSIIFNQFNILVQIEFMNSDKALTSDDCRLSFNHSYTICYDYNYLLFVLYGMVCIHYIQVPKSIDRLFAQEIFSIKLTKTYIIHKIKFEFLDDIS